MILLCALLVVHVVGWIAASRALLYHMNEHSSMLCDSYRIWSAFWGGLPWPFTAIWLAIAIRPRPTTAELRRHAADKEREELERVDERDRKIRELEESELQRPRQAIVDTYLWGGAGKLF